MGPPIYIGGNSGCTCHLGSRCPRFNGATDLHRWKPFILNSYMESSSTLQWGHRFTSVETIWERADGASVRTGFNGATDLHRWKRGRGWAGIAGIWKLQWGHRFTSVETEYGGGFGLWLDMGFNGATDLHRWKPTVCGPWSLNQSTLQWGHRFTSVETKKTYDYCHTVFKLQWGHRFTSVETARCFFNHGMIVYASMGPPIYIGGNLQTILSNPQK